MFRPSSGPTRSTSSGQDESPSSPTIPAGTPSSMPLPRRRAQPVSSAFTAVEMRSAGPEQRPAAVPAARRAWTPSTRRADLPSTVTHFWSLEPDVVAFEDAVRGLAAASLAVAEDGFTPAARDDLREAWQALARAAGDGDFVPRARVGALGVSMSCRAATDLLDSWDDSRAAKLAYEVTGTLLANVLRQGRTVLVESAGQPPLLGALLQRFVAHVHPLPAERPTAESVRDLREVLAELAESHPDEPSRAAFAGCLTELS